MYAFTMCACVFIVTHFASYFRSAFRSTFRSAFLRYGFHSCPLQIQHRRNVCKSSSTHIRTQYNIRGVVQVYLLLSQCK